MTLAFVLNISQVNRLSNDNPFGIHSCEREFGLILSSDDFGIVPLLVAPLLCSFVFHAGEYRGGMVRSHRCGLIQVLFLCQEVGTVNVCLQLACAACTSYP